MVSQRYRSVPQHFLDHAQRHRVAEKQAVPDQKGLHDLYWNSNAQYTILDSRDLRQLYLLQ